MIDATVLFAGLGWRRWSHEILRHAILGDFHLILSPTVIAQARENLLLQLPKRAATFDEWLSRIPFELAPDPSPQEVSDNSDLVRDTEDIPVALAAINAQVDYFVSEDKDFTDDVPTTQKVRRKLKIMRPVIFLREILGWSSEDLEVIRQRNWTDEEK